MGEGKKKERKKTSHKRQLQLPSPRESCRFFSLSPPPSLETNIDPPDRNFCSRLARRPGDKKIPSSIPSPSLEILLKFPPITLSGEIDFNLSLYATHVTTLHQQALLHTLSLSLPLSVFSCPNARVVRSNARVHVRSLAARFSRLKRKIRVLFIDLAFYLAKNAFDFGKLWPSGQGGQGRITICATPCASAPFTVIEILDRAWRGRRYARWIYRCICCTLVQRCKYATGMRNWRKRNAPCLLRSWQFSDNLKFFFFLFEDETNLRR